MSMCVSTTSHFQRSFRCDCGNSKYKEPCKLFKEKDIVNAENKYNHNFRGLYCVCNKPYPDPDGEVRGLDIYMVFEY